jgi:hypothetical protein
MRGASTYFRRIFVLLSCSAVIAVTVGSLGGCVSGRRGGAVDIDWTPSTDKLPAFATHEGEMAVSWDGYHWTADRVGKPYLVLGKVSGRSLFCGAVSPYKNTQLHAKLIETARKHGGNGIIMGCPDRAYIEAIVSEADCYCYCQVIRFIDESDSARFGDLVRYP